MANFNLNKVILGGRVCSDIELRSTPAGISVVSFSIAVNKQSKGDDRADFIDVTAWRNLAEFVSHYFTKGSSICVVGELQSRTWVDKDNVKRHGISVIANEIHFVDSKGERSGMSGNSTYAPEAHGGTVSGNAPRFEDVTSDEDLPF